MVLRLVRGYDNHYIYAICWNIVCYYDLLAFDQALIRQISWPMNELNEFNFEKQKNKINIYCKLPKNVWLRHFRYDFHSINYFKTTVVRCRNLWRKNGSALQTIGYIYLSIYLSIYLCIYMLTIAMNVCRIRFI